MGGGQETFTEPRFPRLQKRDSKIQSCRQQRETTLEAIEPLVNMRGYYYTVNIANAISSRKHDHPDYFKALLEMCSV